MSLITLVLILMPLVMATVAMGFRSNHRRPLLLPLTGFGHLAFTLLKLSRPPVAEGQWIHLDPPGRVVLLVISILFAVCSVYAVGYLRFRGEWPNRVFCG